MNSFKKALVLAALAASALTAKAVPLDFGTNLEAADTYNGTSFKAGADGNTEAQIAALVNGWLGTSLTAADIDKTNPPIAEVVPAGAGAGDGQFYIGSGFDWVFVKYDGPNGGSALFWLGGSDAWVPYDSAPLWGSGDQYAISHYATTGGSTNVPDGGTTAALLGVGLVGASLIARRRK